MGDTGYQEPAALPAEVQFSIRDDVSQDERENAERSVAALVARAKDAAERRRTAEAELVDLTDILTRPMKRLLEDDPDANIAFEKLGNRQLQQPEVLDELRASSVAPHEDQPAPPSAGIRASLGFVPPYHFQWAWHDTNGSPAFGMVQQQATGRLGVDARSGLVEGGASGFVNAHVGYGVFLNWTPGRKFPHAVLNPGRFSHVVRAVGVGSNATSEGGFEITIFEDGRFLTGASRTLWRSRVSGTLFDPDESASGSAGNHVITGPELEFTLQPGRGYTFNAGIWAYSDRSTGVGGGAVQSLIEGVLTRMWVFG